MRAGKAAKWLFLLPALLIYTGLWILPIGASFTLSFTEWKGYGAIRLIGVGNYIQLFRDLLFWSSLRNNVKYAVLSILLGVSIGLVLALSIDRISKGKIFFRTVLFLPVVLSWLSVGLLWKWIYNPTFGLINAGLKAVGLSMLTRNWLGDERLLIYSAIFVAIWKTYGYSMVILLAGLQGIPTELVEASYIDGATELQTILRVVIPLLRPVMSVAIALSLIDAFRAFDVFYIMASGYGMQAGEVLSTLLFKNAFDYTRMGYASSIAVVQFIIVLTISIGYLRSIGNPNH